MQEIDTIEMQEQQAPPISVLDLPVARLQIVQSSEICKDGWPYRTDVEPKLEQNADGLWLLTVRRQGEHGKFDVPYISSEILLADAEMGFVVVLVAYHGTEAYGRKRDKHVVKGQFYHFYKQLESGGWQRVIWLRLNDETRQMVLDLPRPDWARAPGKLSTERKPPAKMVEMISYKVVRLIDGRYYSLYNPDQEYILGERVKQPAKPGHGGGYYSFPTNEMGVNFLESCAQTIPFKALIKTPALALLECEIGGRIINYGHKMSSTYLRPIRVLETRQRE